MTDLNELPTEGVYLFHGSEDQWHELLKATTENGERFKNLILVKGGLLELAGIDEATLKRAGLMRVPKLDPLEPRR